MTISGSGEKPKLSSVENALNTNEAVKVSTRSTAAVNQNNKSEVSLSLLDNSDSEQGISVQLGLAKYLNQELDPQKIRQERLEKIAEIKSKIASGTYLSSVSSDELASKLLEESQVESLIFNKFASNE